MGGTQAITHYGEITDVVNKNKNVRGRKYIFHLSNGLYEYLRSTHHDGQRMKSNYYRLGWANRYYSNEEEIGHRYAEEEMSKLSFLIDNVNKADSKMGKLKR